MKISLNWIYQTLPGLKEKADATQIAKALTHAGLEVEGVSDLAKSFENIVLAKVLTKQKHPNADKLSVLEVFDGKKNLAIVCGAKNVVPDRHFVLAKVGASLPNGLKIKKGKIRGEVSEGMLCSASELGLEAKSSGLLEINQGVTAGQTYIDFAKLDDTILELGITPNRGDCLSHIGVVRDLASLFEISWQDPFLKTNATQTDTQQNENLAFEVKVDATICREYRLTSIEQVNDFQLDEKISNRMQHLEVNSVHPLVDLGNDEMFFSGQPFHVFDADKLNAQLPIEVKKLAKPQKFLALDKKTYELQTGDLVIQNGDHILALAGIIGGSASAVDGQTNNVLIEAASFCATTIRKTARRLGLNTDSSHRFERFVPQAGLGWALQRLENSILQNSKANLSGRFVFAKISQPQKISLSLNQITKTLGVDLTPQKVQEILEKLGVVFETALSEQNTVKVCLPEWRSDLERPIDLTEEVIRIYGMDKIEACAFYAPTKKPTIDENLVLQKKLSQIFHHFGSHQIYRLNFLDENWFESLGFKKEEAIQLSNPLSQDQSYLVYHLLPGLLETYRENLAEAAMGLNFFQIGKVFSKNGEKTVLAALFDKQRAKASWQGQNFAQDFYFIKGFLLEIANALGLAKTQIDLKTDVAYLHPGQSISFKSQNKVWGVLGQLHPEILAYKKLKGPLYYCELDFAVLTQLHSKKKSYQAFAALPKIERDLAFVVDKKVSFGELEKQIQKHKTAYLKGYELFDSYEGKPLADHQKSLSMRLTFHDDHKTLTDEEVNQAFMQLYEHLNQKLGVVFREG